MKNQNGMGIIQGIITIVFIVLIITLIVNFILFKYKEAKRETIKTDMLQVQWKIKDYNDKKIVKKEDKVFLGIKLNEIKDDQVISDFISKNILNEEEKEKFYVLKDEDLKKIGLEITNYKESYFLVNYDDYEIIITKGCNYPNDKILYKLSDINKENK